MYLKSLEIQGFKSFANRVEFEFPSGIAMIVGPNGSGKSNVVDAIRWVLGEQSVKSLRGGKQEDIIFAGSDKRKPVGMAQVSLTLDNSRGLFPLEYNEITVTRRVYRSGESEFLINKSLCRLKDIHELFMDTGLGKEAYSIISQGKVEEIILAKPEDRRYFIEEAAGITKYRHRKLEATKKLTETEQNLTRVEDIVLELQVQLEPLRSQAEAAKQYLNYSSELKGLELGLITNQIQEYHQRLEEISKKLGELKEDLIGKETSVALAEARITETKLELQQKNEALYETQQALFEAATSLEKNESKIKVNEEKKISLEQKLSSLQKEIEMAQERLQLFQEEEKLQSDTYQQLLRDIKEQQELLAKEEGRLVNLASQAQSKKLEEEESKGLLIEILNHIAQTKNVINKKEFELESLQKRLTQNKEQQSSVVNLIEEIKNAAEVNSEKNENIVNLLETKQRDYLAALEEKENNETKLAVIRDDHREVQEALMRVQSRYKTLSELKEDFEGYQRGVKEILQNWQKGHASLQGVRGVVAEVIQVPKKLEVAVEVALGGALQNIITDSDVSAKKAINFLKESNKGRATFLPLNTIKPYRLRSEEQQAIKLEGVLGVAADLVSFSLEFKPVVEYLLGRILIVENVDKALLIAKKTGHKLKIVTLEGEVFNPGGSVTGGSLNRKDSGLLRRSREIEELEKTSKEKEQELAQVMLKERVLIVKVNDFLAKLEKIKEEGQNLKFEASTLEKELLSLGQEKQSQEELLEELKLNAQDLAEMVASIEADLISLNIKLAQELKGEEQLKVKIAHYQNQSQDEERFKDEVSARITEVRVKLASLHQQKTNGEENLYKQKLSIKEVQKVIETKQEELANTFALLTELRKQIEEFREEMKNLFFLKQKSEQEAAIGKDQINLLALTIEEEETKVKVALKETQQFSQLEKELEIKRAKFEAELEGLFRRLNFDYELSFEDAFRERTEIVDKKDSSKLIRELKKKITELGNVNLSAIEDYGKVKERYDFLSQQVLDLKEAKGSLYKVIKEMEIIMTNRFKEAFSLIDDNFRTIFNELFAGGKAYLELTNKESLLETGIEIIAQPPGKKPQHLNLLSGGEKALTAIALLFALLRVRPSPFCVLDEIEASLDEANVDRFAEFLKEFAKESQFVVISHRKGTMVAADILYGITIDDFGVSKMVSLDLHR